MECKVAIIRQWTAEGRLAPVDPRHLLFGIWATTQHYADFSTQVGVLTGRGLGETAFFEETAEAIAGMLLRGVLPRTIHSVIATDTATKTEQWSD